MKNKKLPSFVILMILTLITTVFWISFSVYRVFTEKESPVVPEEISQPLDPKLDTGIIEGIKSRIYP
jgi:hypothetical protein